MSATMTGRIAPVDAAKLPPYSPTTYLDYSQPAHRASYEAALAQVRASFGTEYQIVIGGERL